MLIKQMLVTSNGFCYNHIRCNVPKDADIISTWIFHSIGQLRITSLKIFIGLKKHQLKVYYHNKIIVNDANGNTFIFIQSHHMFSLIIMNLDLNQILICRSTNNKSILSIPICVLTGYRFRWNDSNLAVN